MESNDLTPVEPAGSWNRARYDLHSQRGHYESFFQRANHPHKPQAFWIRYTIFSPQGHPADALGQLWAIFFDGQTGRLYAVKESQPLNQCSFDDQGFNVRIGQARLDAFSLQGRAASGGHTIEWALAYSGDQPPLLLLTPGSYERSFPSAKAVVSLPFAAYTGGLTVDGQELPVHSWVGSQNHNWGSRHTDQYAWGQVAGFDNAPDAFLEIITARLKIGPLWTPWLTNLVLRLGERQFSLNSIPQALRARGHYDYFHWTFDSHTPQVRVSGRIEAVREQFVALSYENPPGGFKTCLNTKIASCRLKVEQTSQPQLELVAGQRAAFEILTDDDRHGVPLAA